MPLSDEDKAEVEKKITDALASEELGKAIGAQVRKIVPGMLTKTEEALKAITESLTGVTAKLTEFDTKLADDPDDKDGKKKKGDADPEVTKHLKKLEADLKAERDKREKAEKDAQEKEAQRLAGLTRSEFLRIATELGIRDPKIVLAYHEKALGVDTDGVTVVGKTKGDDGTDEAVPLTDYLGNWLKTDEGKRFATTEAAGGTGAGKGAKKSGGGAPTLNDVIDNALSGL